MKQQIHKTRILITAAAAGIGRSIAEAFLERGAQVHICDISQKHLAACKAIWPNIGVTQADVSDPAQVERLFQDVVSTMDGLDVLVNNVGISGPTAPVDEISIEDWQTTLAVNLNSHFYCTRQAVPLLKAANGGSIINISSTAGLMGYPWRAPYSTSKWALIGFTKTLAMELGEFNIRVNAVCPGSVEGPRMDRVIAAEARVRNVSEDVVREGYKRQTSLRTFVQVSDIANMVLFLCSEVGEKISGQALSVDGHIETPLN
ncbi:MAG: SDR family oxidoreductase [Chloroflexi bacterium]|nr:SDR family oxidoreductase [Chloroflexota bacterium]